MKKSKLIAIFVFGSTIYACTEDVKRDAKEEAVNEKLTTEAEAPIKEHLDRAYYPIPSPEQMFGFISDNGVAYSNQLMNTTDKVESYTDPSAQALNFGVYTADLAYAAAYQDIEATIKLYKVVKRLGSEMNISEIMTQETMSKMQENMQDPDSLAVIAGDSYYQAVEFLEQNGQEGKLALMSLGGWIESLYITLNAIGDFEENPKTVQRIADQKITFGNLYTYLKKHEDKVGVEGIINQIHDVRDVFASLREERSGKATNTKENGKMVFGGGTKIAISKSQFENLKTAINEFRSKITAIEA